MGSVFSEAAESVLVAPQECLFSVASAFGVAEESAFGPDGSFSRLLREWDNMELRMSDSLLPSCGELRH
jgi:hypothetical protein